MTGIQVKCAYCGQLTKINNCGSFRGMNIHNMSTCNCMQIVIAMESSEFSNRKWFI